MADDRWDLLNDMEEREREREMAVGCFGISGERIEKINKRRSSRGHMPAKSVCVFCMCRLLDFFGARCQQNEGATVQPNFFKFSYELFVFEERVWGVESRKGRYGVSACFDQIGMALIG
jgi:hypothetical protein